MPPTHIRAKKINKGGKAVLQYDLEGNFIKEWVTTMEIQRIRPRFVRRIDCNGSRGTGIVPSRVKTIR